MVLTTVLYLFVLGLTGYAYVQGQRNTKALCTIRKNADDRIEQTQQFLQDHPNGVGGISALDLRRSLQTYQNTVKALQDIDCPPPTTP
jgi:CHASE1-domain containing sensor protein